MKLIRQFVLLMICLGPMAVFAAPTSDTGNILLTFNNRAKGVWIVNPHNKLTVCQRINTPIIDGNTIPVSIGPQDKACIDTDGGGAYVGVSPIGNISEYEYDPVAVHIGQHCTLAYSWGYWKIDGCTPIN